MTRAWPLALAAVLAVLAPERAAGQAWEWWHDETVQRDLALTGVQVDAIDVAFRRDLSKRRGLRDALTRAEAEFDRALAAGNESAALGALPRVVELRRQQNRRRTITLLQMSWVLTDAQRTQLGKRLRPRR